MFLLADTSSRHVFFYYILVNVVLNAINGKIKSINTVALEDRI
jgi:hypothetical protein